LERRDHLQQSISWHRAHTQRFHFRRGEEGLFARTEIDPLVLLRATAENADAAVRLRDIVGDLPHLRLVYEDHLLDASTQPETMRRVCEYLGVSSRPLDSDLIRVSPRRTEDMVSNWQQIVAVFRGSSYAHLVESASARSGAEQS
jgi:hypothetical protein